MFGEEKSTRLREASYLAIPVARAGRLERRHMTILWRFIVIRDS